MPSTEQRPLMRKDVSKITILKKIYFDPRNKASFGSPRKLYIAANAIDKTIQQKDVQTFLQNTGTYTSHKNIKHKFLRRKTIVRGINDQWQIDLISIYNLREQNDNIGYILACIDCFSRYAYVEPLTRKTAEITLAGFKKILHRARKKPRLIQLDQGTEFKSVFKKFLLEHEIKSFSTSQDTKCAIVERYNRTLQDKLYKYMTAKNTLRYLDVLQDIVYSYNHSIHRTLGIAPASVTKENEEELWKKQYGKYLYSEKSHLLFSVGDKVRITKYKTAFSRGYTSRWKEELFQIAYILRTRPVTYVLIDSENEILAGSFYAEELNKIQTV